MSTALEIPMILVGRVDPCGDHPGYDTEPTAAQPDPEPAASHRLRWARARDTPEP
ncbi:hypothetical protein [Nocardia asteroides]|uniref:hypothetical protein n=1 Tax=Nocardia asteroides TaxID=1824 RepID=UPI001E376EB7|nr:hypothetical protein [Nocardia asteroides]UGT61655.1 hypothetical protein LTT61_31875 [Nocardia asteroides]